VFFLGAGGGGDPARFVGFWGCFGFLVGGGGVWGGWFGGGSGGWGGGVGGLGGWGGGVPCLFASSRRVDEIPFFIQPP